MPRNSTAYGSDLASIHHQGFGWAANGASKLLLQELRKRRLPDGLVVDLGSGSGILASNLTAAGYEVLGVELSPAMLKIAKREAPEARFVRASAKDFTPPECIAVTGTGEVLQYEFDRRTSRATMRKVFRRVHRALVPGGIFLFDLSGPGRGGPTGSFERFFEGEGYSMFIRVEENERTGLLVRDHVAFIRDGDRYRRIQEKHHLRLFAPRDVAAELRDIGFTVQTRAGYPGGLDLTGWHVFLAGKR